MTVHPSGIEVNDRATIEAAGYTVLTSGGRGYYSLEVAPGVEVAIEPGVWDGYYLAVYVNGELQTPDKLHVDLVRSRGAD